MTRIAEGPVQSKCSIHEKVYSYSDGILSILGMSVFVNQSKISIAILIR